MADEEAMPMGAATLKINEFLLHLREGDLPDDELFALKAETFRAAAAQARAGGDDVLATMCDGIADAAEKRARAARGPAVFCDYCGWTEGHIGTCPERTSTPGEDRS